MSEPRPDPVVQYVIHPALRAHLDAYLAALGFEVAPVPEQDPDALPTFLVSPTAARLRAVRSGEPVPNLAAPSLPPVLDPLFGTAITDAAVQSVLNATGGLGGGVVELKAAGERRGSKPLEGSLAPLPCPAAVGGGPRMVT